MQKYESYLSSSTSCSAGTSYGQESYCDNMIYLQFTSDKQQQQQKKRFQK